MAILTDYKYYKWIALIPGWYIGDFVGAIASYFLVDAIMSNKKEALPLNLFQFLSPSIKYFIAFVV